VQLVVLQVHTCRQKQLAKLDSLCNGFDVVDLVVKMDLKESKNYFRKRECIRRHQFLFVLLAGESH